MRNYRTMTADERDELERLYPVTPNRELSRRFDISVDAIQDHFAKPLGWKKDHKAVLIGSRGGRTLTEREVAWIVQHYKHTRNEDIMRRFDIGESTLHRLARKHGLRKSRQQMRKMQAAAAETARQTCVDYGVYEQTAERMRQKMRDLHASGEYFPGGFKPGVSNKDRMSPRRYRETVARAHAKRNETIRKDRLRLSWGLPQKSRMRLSLADEKTRRRKAHYRMMLRKRGYIVERGSSTVWYDDQTDRYEPMERRASANGFAILSAHADPATRHVAAIHGPRHYESWRA